MRVALTGVTGFVGRHVLAELEKRGERPVCVLRPGAGLPPSLAGRQVVPIDLSRPPADAFDQLGRPDVLVHLAWGGLPNYKSLHHFERELPLHYGFLAAMVRAGLRHVVGVGTCFEYGMQSGCLAETLDSRPSNPYGYAKDALRRQLQFLQSVSPFELSWGRLFYVFGDGQSPNSLLSQLHATAARGDDRFDMSMGEQLRDFLPIGEAARCLVELACSPAGAGLVNVCSGVPISVRRRVELWMQEFGWTFRLNPGRFPYPDYEPMAFWGDSRKLAAVLAARGAPLVSTPPGAYA